MIVEGTISEASFVSLSRRLFYRRPAVLLLHMAVMGVGLYWTSRPALEGTAALGWLPLLILVVLFLFVSRRARDQYRRNRTLQARVRYEIREEGLALQTPEARGLLPWKDIARIEETPGHVVVYGTRRQAFVLGKDWFASAGDRDAFVSGVEAAVKASVAAE
ncbi:MAG: YcxB family protein [Thermodesulfobacteriota bacterium]